MASRKQQNNDGLHMYDKDTIINGLYETFTDEQIERLKRYLRNKKLSEQNIEKKKPSIEDSHKWYENENQSHGNFTMNVEVKGLNLQRLKYIDKQAIKLVHGYIRKTLKKSIPTDISNIYCFIMI